ncbi:hypothetical protein C8R43DRAFT_956008 [Mycena crocata]|nr:hypothetical protein C8R43DRAFT_956008 [Mycena crocata]
MASSAAPSASASALSLVAAPSVPTAVIPIHEAVTESKASFWLVSPGSSILILHSLIRTPSERLAAGMPRGGPRLPRFFPRGTVDPFMDSDTMPIRWTEACSRLHAFKSTPICSPAADSEAEKSAVTDFCRSGSANQYSRNNEGRGPDALSAQSCIQLTNFHFQALPAGHFKLRAKDWPSCFYVNDTYDPTKRDIGLCRVPVTRALILYSLSGIANDNSIPQVTPEFVACGLVQELPVLQPPPPPLLLPPAPLDCFMHFPTTNNAVIHRFYFYWLSATLPRISDGECGITAFGCYTPNSNIYPQQQLVEDKDHTEKAKYLFIATIYMSGTPTSEFEFGVALPITTSTALYSGVIARARNLSQILPSPQDASNRNCIVYQAPSARMLE